MQSVGREWGQDLGGGSPLARRALATPIVPFSVVWLICFVWMLLHLVVWWQCTATHEDCATLWLGTGSPLTSTLAMLLFAGTMSGILVYFEWRYERALLGVRDWKRTGIYGLGITVSASLVILFMVIAELVAPLLGGRLR